MARTERHLSYVDAELEEAQGEVPERMAPPRARPEGPKGGRGQGRLEESPTARWKREDRELSSRARNHHYRRELVELEPKWLRELVELPALRFCRRNVRIQKRARSRA